MSRPTIVLLPGLDGTGLLFRPIVEELEGELETVTVSYDQEKQQSYQSLADEVAKSLPQKDYYILGESFSGPIALILASRKPRGLKGIILCATFISNPSSIFPTWLAFLIRAPLFSVWPVSVTASVLTGGTASPQIKDLVRRAKAASTTKALASRTREVLKVNVSKELKECIYPVLYLRGARDFVVTSRNLKNIKTIKKDIKDSTINASHLVLQEAARESAKEILKFIKTST